MRDREVRTQWFLKAEDAFQPPEALQDPLNREYAFGGYTYRPDDPQTKFYMYTSPDPTVHDIHLREFEIKALLDYQKGKA